MLFHPQKPPHRQQHMPNLGPWVQKASKCNLHKEAIKRDKKMLSVPRYFIYLHWWNRSTGVLYSFRKGYIYKIKFPGPDQSLSDISINQGYGVIEAWNEIRTSPGALFHAQDLSLVPCQTPSEILLADLAPVGIMPPLDFLQESAIH